MFIGFDLHHARSLSKKNLFCCSLTRYFPIFLLSVCLPCHAQVTKPLPASDDLSTGATPEKPYESLERSSIQAPIHPVEFRSLGCATGLSSDELQAESGVTCDAPSARADYSASLNPHQQTSGYQAPDRDEPQASNSDGRTQVSKPINALAHSREPLDINSEIYRRNRLDFGLDVGWHPVNIPFIYDFAVGDSYNMTPLKYTLVPMIASLRWQVTNVGWPWIFRGNMDFTFSGSVTLIPRGTETHYYAFMFGIRRNFVHRNWKAVPFFEQRGGAGMIDAKEPLGVLFSQGQNLTFTYTLGVGVRYSFDTKYSLSAGMNYMHISNGYLSEPKFTNYGINVYGPMFGFNMRLGKPHEASE